MTVLCSLAACSCNNTGTENGTNCEKLRGQCRCKPGVAGRSCDHCLPGYFNFTDSGCTGMHNSSYIKMMQYKDIALIGIFFAETANKGSCILLEFRGTD